MTVFRQPFVRFIFGIISLILSVGIIHSIVRQLSRGTVVDERNRALEREKMRNEQLIERLKESTESAYIERVAREKLGLVKDGDTIVLLDRVVEENGGTGEKNEEMTSWQKWWTLVQ